MHGIVGFIKVSFPNNNGNNSRKRDPDKSECKPSSSGLSSLAPSGSAGTNYQRDQAFVKNRTQPDYRESESTHSIKTQDTMPCTGQEMQSALKGINTLKEYGRCHEDGHKWRKYGQKQVKGIKFLRSYYKCTHPKCQVKKQLEHSSDGTIADIRYKGNHHHPKPHANKCTLAGKASSADLYTSQDIQLNGKHELFPVTTSECVWQQPNRNNEVVDEDDSDNDSESKHRRENIYRKDADPKGKAVGEPHVVVQTLSGIDILDDGYRWHKYGQKVVRGNPNPRSYYKCTNFGCTVKKHVERASHDVKAVITTYKGKHNHDLPTSRTNPHNKTEPKFHNKATKCILRTGSEESDTISLDLGVGISTSSKSRLNKKQRRQHMQNLLHTKAMQSQYPVDQKED